MKSFKTKEDKFIDECVNRKYKSYYPVEPCIQDNNTPNRKKHSMCTYCYSCYVELCESIKEGFNVTINNNGVWTHECLEKVCKKARNYISVTTEEVVLLTKRNLESIIDILNKYTKYSFIPKEGHNLLHREFIESLMEPLRLIILSYYFFEVTYYNHMYNSDIRKYVLINLNLFCFDVYCAHTFWKNGFVTTHIHKLYSMIYEKTKRLCLLQINE